MLRTLRGRVIPEAEREARSLRPSRRSGAHGCGVAGGRGADAGGECRCRAVGAQTNTDYEARYREECAKRAAYIPLKKGR